MRIKKNTRRKTIHDGPLRAAKQHELFSNGRVFFENGRKRPTNPKYRWEKFAALADPIPVGTNENA